MENMRAERPNGWYFGTTGKNVWRINLDENPVTCSLGKKATIKSGDDGTHTVVGWKADYTPVPTLTNLMCLTIVTQSACSASGGIAYSFS